MVTIDLSGLGCEATDIRWTVDDYCGAGCTNAKGFVGRTEMAFASNTGSGKQTVTLTSTNPMDRTTAESFEGALCGVEIR